MKRVSRNIVLACCLVGSSCSGSADKSIQEAELSLKNKDYAGAIVSLRNALQQDPASGRARLLLAQAYESSGQRRPARDAFVRAADLMPSDMQAQLGAARLLLRNRDFEDARTRAQRVLELDPKNTEAFLIRGRAAAGMDDLEDAHESFEAGIGLEPGRTDLLVNRARLEVVQGKAAEAEASFKQAMTVAPQSVEPRVALADFYWYTGKLSEAEAVLKEAASLPDPRGRVARMLAGLYISTNRAADAEEPLKRAASVSDDPLLKGLLADYYLLTGRPEPATPLLEALAADPRTYSLATLRLATLEFSKPAHGKAYELIDQAIKKEPVNTLLRVQKAVFLSLEGRREEALKLVEAAIQENPNFAPAFELLGSLRLEGGELPQAEAALKETVRLDGRSTRAMVLLATLQLAKGQTSEAVELADRALQLQPNPEARLTLVRALTAAGQTDRARQEIAKLPKDSAPVQIELGRLELRSGNSKDARVAFQRAISQQPASLAAVQGLVQLDLLDNKPEEAINRIQPILAKDPANAEALLLAARAHVAADNLPEAEKYARQALEKDPNLRPVYDLLGRVYRRQNRLEEAQRTFEKVTAERPQDVPAHTMVGILQLVRGNEAGARERFEKVLALDSRAAVASNNLAYMDAEHGTNLDIALNRAQTAKAALPDDPEISDTLGWVYVKRGLPTLAYPNFEQAIQQDPSNPLYHYHLGMAYAANSDKDRARQSLQKALQLSASFPGAAEAKRTLASLGQ